MSEQQKEDEAFRGVMFESGTSYLKKYCGIRWLRARAWDHHSCDEHCVGSVPVH